MNVRRRRRRRQQPHQVGRWCQTAASPNGPRCRPTIPTAWERQLDALEPDADRVLGR